MDSLGPGSVVTVRFPFSDLSASKARPALIIATLERGDFVLCQITSKAYSDSSAIEISDSDFASGSLQRTSYVRPGKLFTANMSIVSGHVGILSSRAFESVRRSLTAIVNGSPVD